MKDRYVCSRESEIMCTTNEIMEDLVGVPNEVEDDLRQEICLFFLQKQHIHCAMQISSAEIYNLLGVICRRYCGAAHRLPTPNFHDTIARYFNFA